MLGLGINIIIILMKLNAYNEFVNWFKNDIKFINSIPFKNLKEKILIKKTILSKYEILLLIFFNFETITILRVRFFGNDMKKKRKILKVIKPRIIFFILYQIFWQFLLAYFRKLYLYILSPFRAKIFFISFMIIVMYLLSIIFFTSSNSIFVSSNSSWCSSF